MHATYPAPFSLLVTQDVMKSTNFVKIKECAVFSFVVGVVCRYCVWQLDETILGLNILASSIRNAMSGSSGFK